MGVGYMSKATACGHTVLGTSSSISPSFERIESQGARGAGYLQAGLSVFAWDYAKWEGSLTWDLSKGDGSFAAVKQWAVINRNSENTLEAQPGGSYTLSVTGYNTSFNGNTSSNSLVSISAGALGVGDSAGELSGSGGGTPTATGGDNKFCGDNGVVPYWMSSATLSTGGGCAIEWSFDITNSVIPVCCCNGSTGNHLDKPTYVLLGATDATASATFYEGSPPADFWGRNNTLTINTGDGSITIKGVIEGTDLSLQTGDAIIGFGVTIHGVGCEAGCVS